MNKKMIALSALVALAVAAAVILVIHSKSADSAKTTTKPAAWKDHTISGGKIHFSFPADWSMADQLSTAKGPPHRRVILYSADHTTTMYIDDGFSRTTTPAALPLLKTEKISLLKGDYYLAFGQAKDQGGAKRVFSRIISDPTDINSLLPSPDVSDTYNGAHYVTPLIDINLNSTQDHGSVESLEKTEAFKIAVKIMQTLDY